MQNLLIHTILLALSAMVALNFGIVNFILITGTLYIFVTNQNFVRYHNTRKGA